jgi:hypothetical protein
MESYPPTANCKSDPIRIDYGGAPRHHTLRGRGQMVALRKDRSATDGPFMADPTFSSTGSTW